MLRKILIAFVVLVVAGGTFYAAGPRVAVDTTITFNSADIGDDVDAYLAAREARFNNIREGLQKEVIWAYPTSRAKTPIAIVYVHGFSSSKGETRPFSDIIARELGANLFYTRLTGHAQPGDTLGEATVNDWVNDMAEAAAIGRRIGEKVIIIATSTGGGLTAWASAQPHMLDGVSGIILISPLFGLHDPSSFVLTLPWGQALAEMIAGEERSSEPRSELQAKINTTKYPTKALLPVAAIALIANEAAYEKDEIPALFLISDRDQVVRPDLTRLNAARWGAPAEIITVENADDPSQHVITGDALSPSTTDELAARAIEWIRKTVNP